jgi:hypothetical protein
LIWLTGAPAALPAEPELTMPRLFHDLSKETVTPHIAWAKGLAPRQGSGQAGNRLRALVIGERWGQRETVELMERMDIDCETMLAYTAKEIGHTGTGGWGHERPQSIQMPAVLKDLRAKLAGDYDVIVLGQPALASFPKDATEAILAKVHAGTGLVWFWPAAEPREFVAAIQAVKPPPAGPDAPGEEGEAGLVDKQAVAWKRISFLVAGVPFEQLPQFGIADARKQAGEVIQPHEYGKGRVLFVRYGRGQYGVGGATDTILTPAAGDDLSYEYYMSFAIKAILWAARQEPAVLFEPAPPGAGDPGGKLDFAVRNTQAAALAATVDLAIRPRDPLCRLPAEPWASPGVHQTAALLAPIHTARTTATLAAGSSTLHLDLPPLPGGEYFADVELSSAQGKINWATYPLHITAAHRIKEMVLAPAALDATKDPKLAVTVGLALAAAAPQGAAVSFAAVDAHNRLLELRTVPLTPGATKTEATLSLAATASTLVNVRAALVVDGRVQSIASARATVYNRPWDDFTFFAWGGLGQGYVDHQRYRVLADLGVDAVRGGVTADALAVADIRSVADLGWFNGSVDPKTDVVSPCFSSEPFRTKLTASIETALAARKVSDCFGYMVGDEFGFLRSGGGLPGSCNCPSCVAGLRVFLRDRYRTVEALNAQWGSRYGSLEDVLPLKRASRNDPASLADFARMQATHNYSQQIDQWLYDYRVFADAFGFCHDQIAQRDPRAHFGPSTPLWNYFYRAYDWPGILKHCDFATPYGPWGDYSSFESIRSFLARSGVLSAHYGSYVEPILHDEDHFAMVPYAILLRGGTNAFWYTTWGNEGGLSPWLDPYPCLGASSRSIAEIKAGPATLLRGSTRQHDGIAIHYSTPSILFSFLVSGPHVPWQINAVLYAVQELGFQANLVSTEQILAGGLSGYRVLVLPVSQAIGDDEAGKIRQFIEAGGVVIADVRPGIADGAGNVGGRKVMGELFGLTWGDDLYTDPNPDAKKRQPIRPLAPIDGARLAGSYGEPPVAFACADRPPQDGAKPEPLSADTCVRLSGAKAAVDAGGTPLVTYRRTGKGTAICLNTTFAGREALLRALLQAHGVKPMVAIESRQPNQQPGDWLGGLEFTRFVDGQATYVGLTRRRLFDDRDKQPGDVKVNLGEARCVVDMRTGERLGRHDTIALSLAPSGMRLLAALPYELRELKIAPGEPVCRRGEDLAVTVDVVTDGPAPGRHVIHLAAQRPDGKTVRYLACNAETANGKAVFHIRPCLNEPTGQWTLTFTDSATRLRKELHLDMRE